MATKDTVVPELVVNTLTQAQFDAAKEAGTLSPYELYGTPDTTSEQLKNKLDVGLGNAVAETKTTIVGWGIPDYSAGIDIAASIATGYTAPTDGFISVSYAQGNSAVTCTINGNTITVWGSSGSVYSSFYYLFLSKNDVFKLGSTSLTKSANFYPLKGAN